MSRWDSPELEDHPEQETEPSPTPPELELGHLGELGTLAARTQHCKPCKKVEKRPEEGERKPAPYGELG